MSIGDPSKRVEVGLIKMFFENNENKQKQNEAGDGTLFEKALQFCFYKKSKTLQKVKHRWR